MELSEQKLREAIKNGIKTINEKVTKKDIINTIKRINKWGEDKGYKINPFLMYKEPTHIHKKLGPVMIHPGVRAYDWRNDGEIAVSTSYANAKGWSFVKADFKDLDELPKNFELPKEWIGESKLTEGEFVIIDTRGNARDVGSKIQGQRFLKGKKGFHIVLKKNALKARRAIEKNGGKTTGSKITDILYDMMYENINEDGDSKKYKQFWDKGPETQIRRKFGKEYNNAIENRVSLLLALVNDPDKAEDYAEMDFLSLPDDIATQLVNMDPKELHSILDESVNEGISKSAIKKLIKIIDKQIDTETGGDGEALDNETLQELEQERERLESMIESTLTESNKYTVAWSDGVRGGDEFKKKDDAMKYAKDLIRDNKRLQYVSVHRPGMTQTAHREDLLAWWGPGDMWDNKAKKDKTLYDIQIDESVVNESVIGIKTERDFKAKTLIAALDKAKVKYKINRLSMTLSVLDLDKKYFDDAKKVVADLGLSVMLAKESKVNEGKAQDKVYELVKDMPANAYKNLAWEHDIPEEDPSAMEDFIFNLSNSEAKALTAEIKQKVYESKLYEASIELDAIDPESKDLAKLLKKNNVKMDIITMNGPGGGNPLVKLIGKRKDLEKVIADSKYGWDDPELEEFIEESKVNEHCNQENKRN